MQRNRMLANTPSSRAVQESKMSKDCPLKAKASAAFKSWSQLKRNPSSLQWLVENPGWAAFSKELTEPTRENMPRKGSLQNLFC